MSILEMEAKAKEIKELKRMAEDLAAEITTLEDEIKAAMGEREQMVAGAFKITYKAVTSSRIDTSAFKKTMPELAERFLKTTTTKRFQIA